MTQLSRRSLLTAGLGLLGGSALAACGGTGGGPAASGGGGGGGGSNALQMTWWGSPERHKRTQEALKKFEELHKDVKIRSQFSGWDGYWEKLATQTAGGQPPDLIQMDYAYITEYAGRGALEPLDGYVGKKLEVDDWQDAALSGGKVDGKLYGMNAGINSMALMYNDELIKELGFEVPDYKMSWDDYVALCKQIKAKAPDGVYATQNGLFESLPFEAWLRQRGKNIYADGKLGYAPADLTEWFSLWLDLQKSGVAASAEEQATAVGDVQNSLLVRKKSVFHFGHSNQLTAFSGLSKFEVGLHMFPGGDKQGQYYKPSQLFTVSAKSKAKDATVDVVNALLNVPDVAILLGSERGVPAKPAVKDALTPKASETDKRVFEYIDFLADKVGPTPAPPPKGSTDIGTALSDAGELIAFGKTPVDQAVEKFFGEAERILGK